MSGKQNENFRIAFDKLQQNIDVFKQKRDDLNKKIEDYISIYQNIETEIIESYINNRVKFAKRRKYCNEKIRSLRNEEKEYHNLLEKLIDKSQGLHQSKIDNKSLKNIESLRNSASQITNKIKNLEELIKTDNLNIKEESEIIDRIRRLDEIKQEKMILIAKKEQAQRAIQQSNEFYKNQKNIEFIKNKIEDIKRQMNKVSSQRLNTRNLMLDFLQKVYKLKDNKKKMEKELIKNKRVSEQYHFQFSKMLHCEKGGSKDKKTHQRYSKQKSDPKDKVRIKNKKKLKKLKQEKLKIALEKKRAGKRLDIHEYRLIMENKKTS